MADFFLYASFPNSRIKPRSATSQAFTFQVPINSYNGAGVKATIVTDTFDSQPNRTYFSMFNPHATQNCLYIYATESDTINPSVTPTFGLRNALRWFPDTTGQLYRKDDNEGATNNWVPVNIQDVADTILPKQRLTLESTETIYAAIDSNVLLPTIFLEMDYGLG